MIYSAVFIFRLPPNKAKDQLRNSSYIGLLLVHRLSLYLSTGEWGEVARHKCRNRNCVNPDHLEWGNTTENSHDRYRDNTMPVGEKCHLSKLTDTQVLEIREKYVPYHCTSTILSDEYGVYKSTIKKIISRSIWKHI